MYLSHYLATRTDRLKARVRVALLRGALGLVAAVVATTVLVVAVVLVALGIAHGLAVLVGSEWAGELFAGGGFLIVMAVGAWAAVSFLRIRSQNRIRREYERRREQERRAAGRDVAG
jgi:ABC-type nickel/cobalt efflux system permease component RcnA